MGVVWNKLKRDEWEQLQVRPCRECKEIKPWTDFHRAKSCLFGINSVCKACREPVSKVTYRNWTNEYRLYHSAKSRARRANLDFNITVKDILIPVNCPVFGFPLVKKTHGPVQWNSPSLDRINPNLGYIKGNITVMSWRANMLKNNMTLEEAQKLVTYLGRVL